MGDRAACRIESLGHPPSAKVCNFGDALVGVSAKFMFPKSEDAHACSSQLFVVRLIATLVALDFQGPERPVCTWHMSAAATSMPETAIDKNGEMLLRKKEVRPANETSLGCITQPVKEAVAQNHNLGCCVLHPHHLPWEHKLYEPRPIGAAYSLTLSRTSGASETMKRSRRFSAVPTGDTRRLLRSPSRFVLPR